MVGPIIAKTYYIMNKLAPKILRQHHNHTAILLYTTYRFLERQRGICACLDRNRITADCVRGFRFLADLTQDERLLANDPNRRERALWETLRAATIGA
jgi:hypothetical protein